jgi:hypothetical protein
MTPSRKVIWNIMYQSLPERRKMRLAKRARKSDSDYLHAQLILAGQTVTSDTITGTSHIYYFDCGCVRRFQIDVPLNERESLEPCDGHKGLVTRGQQLRT